MSRGRTAEAAALRLAWWRQGATDQDSWTGVVSSEQKEWRDREKNARDLGVTGVNDQETSHWEFHWTSTSWKWEERRAGLRGRWEQREMVDERGQPHGMYACGAPRWSIPGEEGVHWHKTAHTTRLRQRLKAAEGMERGVGLDPPRPWGAPRLVECEAGCEEACDCNTREESTVVRYGNAVATVRGAMVRTGTGAKGGERMGVAALAAKGRRETTGSWGGEWRRLEWTLTRGGAAVCPDWVLRCGQTPDEAIGRGRAVEEVTPCRRGCKLFPCVTIETGVRAELPEHTGDQ